MEYGALWFWQREGKNYSEMAEGTDKTRKQIQKMALKLGFAFEKYTATAIKTDHRTFAYGPCIACGKRCAVADLESWECRDCRAVARMEGNVDLAKERLMYRERIKQRDGEHAAGRTYTHLLDKWWLR
jgi:hypothetical protein